MKAFLGVVGFLVVFYGFSQLGFAQEKWLVRSKNSSSKVQFTLLENGSIQRVNRGDPKTTYDQSENRFHSEKQRAKKQTTQPTFDLTGWLIGSQGNGPSTDWHVTYYSLASGTNEQFIVVYDLTTGTIKSVTRQTITTTTEMPDLSGWVIAIGYPYTYSDGTSRAVYSKPDVSYIDGKKDTMIVDYDASGNFVKASITTYETLSLDAVKVPPYYTDRYGWTSGT